MRISARAIVAVTLTCMMIMGGMPPKFLSGLAGDGGRDASQDDDGPVSATDHTASRGTPGAPIRIDGDADFTNASGVHLWDSNDTLAHHNNFILNNGTGQQAWDNSTGTSWDNGTEGNFWTDYTGTDGNGDGIGDTPHDVPGGPLNEDNHPLMWALNDVEPPFFVADSSPAGATTGDPYLFNVTIDDNLGVTNVSVEYWFGAGVHYNHTMNNTYLDAWTLQTMVGANQTASLVYIFHAGDAANNWNQTAQATVPVTDNDALVFWEDTSPSNGTTGDPYTFRINITDNIGVSSASVEFWFGTGPHYNWSMNGSLPWQLTMDLPHTLDDMHYVFHANDTSGVWNSTGVVDVTLADNDLPVFLTNSTPAAATTGGSVTFDIDVSDNIALSGVWVEWWFGTGTHHYWQMNNTGTWTLQLSIPTDSTDTLHYRFHANDTSDNVNASAQSDITVSDDDAPVFGTDNTPSSGTTGDPFTFSVDITDNVGVTQAWVRFGFGASGPVYNWSMNNTGSWTLTMDLPADSAPSMNYSFWAADGDGNWAATGLAQVTVTDNDPVHFISDTTDAAGTTGEQVTFRVQASDNLGVSLVKVVYRFGTGAWHNWTMNGTGTYTQALDIPAGSDDDVTYYFYAEDVSGLWNITAWSAIAVSDNDRPVFGADTSDAAATTGDPFTFTIAVSDNMGVTQVRVEYWFGAMAPSNVTMGGAGPYSLVIDIPAGSVAPLHYIFHARDARGNWNATAQADVNVTDDDLPVFSSDTTPDNCTTGETITLSVQVADNLAVHTVTAEYWFGTGAHFNWTMNGTTTYTLLLDVPSSSSANLHYVFHANDTSGGWNATPPASSDVRDNDAPSFGTDTTPSAATTGDTLTFRVQASDNVGISLVTVEYWFGTGVHTNTTMSGPSPYSKAIQIPAGSLLELHYLFHCNDSSGNWNITPQKDVPVSDNDAPLFGTDSTPPSGTTGESVTMRTAVSDNIGVVNVTVEHWFGTGAHANAIMTLDAGTYSFTVDVPAGSADDLHYIFHARDAKGNTAATAKRTVTINDNDKPALGKDSSPETGTTGEDYTFRVTFSDNIGVVNVTVEYWFGSGTHKNATLTGTGTYTRTITLPSGSIATMHYRFRARDAAANLYAGSAKDVTITDNDLPVFGADATPATGTTGDPLTFSIAASDNVGLANVTVEYWFGTGARTNATMTSGAAWTYRLVLPKGSTASVSYRFWANDTSGNLVNTSARTVTVSDDDGPVFGDDASSVSATTGDPFFFSIPVSDNIGLKNVTVEYWMGNGTHVNLTMSVTRGTYAANFTVPADAAGALSYFFKAADKAGNKASTALVALNVTDDDGPLFGEDYTPASATTGDTITISIEVTDNAGLAWVRAEHWFGDGEHTTELMTAGRGVYRLSVDVPGSSTESLHYIISASDLSGNEARGTEAVVGILDDDPPAAVAGAHVSVPAGTTVTFAGNGSTDNVGVANYTWTFTDGGNPVTLHGVAPSYTFVNTGEYTVNLTVRDAAGNSAHDTLTVTVTGGDGGGGTDVSFGPFTDEEGNPLEGAQVTVVVDGVGYTGITDASGVAVVELPEDVAGTDVDVSVSKEGYEDINYNTTVDDEGAPDEVPPPAVRSDEEKESDEDEAAWTNTVLCVVGLVVLLLLIFLLARRRGKRDDGWDDKAGEDEEGAEGDDGFAPDDEPEEDVEFEDAAGEADEAIGTEETGDDAEAVEEGGGTMAGARLTECPVCTAPLAEDDTECPECGESLEGLGSDDDDDWDSGKDDWSDDEE